MGTSRYGFGEPYIDADEWREEPRRHRYVHGGFADSVTRFSIYMPPEEIYRGRFFQFLQGGAGGSEHSLAVRMAGVTGDWIFDVVFDELGGYLVESNQGHLGNQGNLGLDGDVELFGASAESALFAKQVAATMYGMPPHHGYLWGPSGGGHRTTKCMENRPDVWAGGSPHVIGGTGGAQSWSAWAYWWLLCRDKLDDIVDATAPGGSGDPFASLTTDEREALATLYRAGWPRGAESSLGPFFSWLFQIVNMRQHDPTYVDDFWSTRGYAGHDEIARMTNLLVDETYTVAQTLERGIGEQWVLNPLGTSAIRLPDGAADAMTSGQGRGATYGLVLDRELPATDKVYLAAITVLSGEAQGRHAHVNQGPDQLSVIGLGLDEPDMFDGVRPGDRVRLDNRELIAFAHLWRHAITIDDLYVRDASTGERTLAREYSGIAASMIDGRPFFPQRVVSGYSSGQTGRFEGKMIHVAATHDVMVMPAWVPSYERLVRGHLGERLDDQYRLWWVEQSDHAGPYGGVTAQALRDLVAWCEDGIAPPSSTSYVVSGDGSVTLAPTAEERHGVQPVVRVSANGASRADVRVGEPVHFVGVADQPPGTGTIVSATWDFESVHVPFMQRVFLGAEAPVGPGETREFDGDATSVKVEASHAYELPGTYFAKLTVYAHRAGRGGLAPIQNEARARVVVG